MPSHLPSIKQLRYFVALEQHRHFGLAASTCFVSQPAFSAGIKELEASLGVQLIDRTNRSVTITRTGQEVATQARLVLRDLEALVDISRDDRSPFSGELTLGVIPTIAPFLLPRLLPKLRRQYPRLKLLLREDMTQPLHEQLLEGKLDLIMLALPFDLPKTRTVELFADEFLLACHKNSALMDPSDYSPDRLPPHSVLLLEDGHCLRDHAIASCRIRNRQTISPFNATSLLTLVHMVDADLGITYLPELALKAGLLKGTAVKTHRLAKPVSRQIALAWRVGSAREVEFNALGKFITANRA